MEVTPARLRIRWNDPMIDQPPAGRWVEIGDIDILHHQAVMNQKVL